MPRSRSMKELVEQQRGSGVGGVVGSPDLAMSQGALASAATSSGGHESKSPEDILEKVEKIKKIASLFGAGA